MTGFNTKANGDMGADHEPSMALLRNGGKIHPIHPKSSRTQRGAIREQRAVKQRRSYFLTVVASFLILSRTSNVHRMTFFQTNHLQGLNSPAHSTSTTTSSSKMHSSSSYDIALETFVVQDDLFNNNSKVPNNEEAFELENFGQARCGGRKCFVRLKSNQDVGYLIAHEGATFTAHIYKEFNRTWTLAKRLQQDYNVSTLLLEPPLELLDKDIHFVNQLNALLATADREGGKTNPIRISTEGPLVVQKVQVAPEPNMLWHMLWAKELSQDLKVYMHFLNISVTGDKGNFSRSLLDNLSVMRQIVQDMEYSCLTKDFQFIIDYEGGIHHLDLDRCFQAHGNITSIRRRHKSVSRAIGFLDTVGDCFRKALRAFNVSTINNDKEDYLRPSFGCMQ
jgi:hypothetical protein